LLIVPSALAQISFEQAVETAGTKYPAVRASIEQASAAAAAVNLARNAYLPRADFGAQLNRATHNNVFGLLFPQGGIFPGIFRAGAGDEFAGQRMGISSGGTGNLGAF